MIYIATHKYFEFNGLNGYCPLHVGAEGKNDLGYLKDNSGQNISEKNSNFCELTGLYWIWKNTKDLNKGLVHYRRYFSNSFEYKPIEIKDVDKILNKYDVILPFEVSMKISVEDQYENCGFKKDLALVRNIIESRYPDYLEDYDDFLKSKDIRFFNMIIAKNQVFDDYCEWLFDILFELEKEINLDEYTDYQKRIFGFLSERLLNVYFRKNKYKIYECGIYPTEIDWSIYRKIGCGVKRKIYDFVQLNIKG